MYVLFDSSVDKLPSKIIYKQDETIFYRLDYEELLVLHYEHIRYSANPQSYIDVLGTFIEDSDTLIYRYRVINPTPDRFSIKFMVTKLWKLDGTSRFEYKGNEYYLDLATKS